MPTNANRPFLSNFLAAFRAQSAFQSAAPSPAPQSSTTTASAKPATQSYTTSSTTYDPSSRPTAAAAIAKPNASTTTTTTTTTGATAATTTATQTSSFSPYGKSPSTPGTPPQTSGGYTNYNNGYPIPGASSSPSRHRRGSDSSSDGGFRERTGSAGGSAMPEKWYIGGRTPGGEERFYKLGMVRRMRSSDRMSLDRLSL